MKKLALVFPGQGSQTIGMLAEFAMQYPIVVKTFAEASEVLGYDLWRLAQEGPEEQLNNTQYAQPILLAADVAVYRVWQQSGGVKPIMFAGHSLGEYAALVCAEALSFSDALKLVAERGRIMQEAVPNGQGKMAAIIGLDQSKVCEICKDAAEDQVVAPANYNSTGQIVIAGNAEAVDRAAVLAKKAGAKLVKILAVSIPSHCELMRDAAVQLGDILQDIVIETPKIPVVHNVDVKSYEDKDLIRDALIRQFYSPVRWIETVEFMVQNGITHVFECGPGKVLTGLNKRINRNLVVNNIGESQNLQNVLELVLI